MLHYHGTPITPKESLLTMAGKHFCVSYGTTARNDADTVMAIGQSIMWDNGAFSVYNAGKKPDWLGFYRWLEPRLGHPHWAVVPDVIGGDVDAQRNLISQWPHTRSLSAPVWHMGMPVDYLLELVDGGWGKICFGSSAEYWSVGSPSWESRCDEAFNALAKSGPLPWVHMLRGLSTTGKRWPFASADSCSVAIHTVGNGTRPHAEMEMVARSIDAVQTPIRWQQRPVQINFGEMIA